MKTIIKGCTILVLGVAAAACSSSPPPELKDARVAYQRAAQSPNASLAPIPLHEARQSLARAEKEFEDEGDDKSTRDLAYVAKRKALSANAVADTERALHDKRVALASLEAARKQKAMAMQEQLDTTKQSLSQTQQELDSARQAKELANKRAKDALAMIEGLQTKESERGLTLTLSGSVLFASAKSVLLPEAQERLTQVSNALRDDTRKITIVGHTDSQGKEEMNKDLSERRASSVKAFLVRQGIDSDRISTEGAGESQPIADNESAEGRANNRRVEIILEDASPSGAQPQGADQGTGSSGPTP